MCWVALDRLLRLHRAGQLRAPVDLFEREREALRAEIEARGFNQRLGSYVSVYDGDELDASLLLLARHGFVDPRSQRARGTRDAVLDRLGANGLLYRYRGVDDGLPGDEGAFGICSFWAVDAYALAGEIEAAEALFEGVLGHANDLWLFAEQIDPADGSALGNFPQAFTHVGLVDAALVLEAARSNEERPQAQASDL
jgi:GH15 family glucan-1,4-alpha-glucosidase